jgi:chromosome segregation ATPase
MKTMSENAEQLNNVIDDVIESVIGGSHEDANHSQNNADDTSNPLVPDGTENNAPETEKVEDSAEKKYPDLKAMQEEIANLSKRLHDTQSAMHRATEERSKLEKELNALKSKEVDEDDWFSEEDKERSEQLEGDLKKSDEELSKLEGEKTSIEVKAAEAIWDAAAAKVIAEHPDFEEVVYGKLAPMIDENNTAPEAKRVRELYMSMSDRSPAAAYKFAKELEDRLLMDSDPEAYKQKVRSEVEREYRGENLNIEGKEGLDLLNSADGAYYNSVTPTGDVLDFLPK